MAHETGVALRIDARYSRGYGRSGRFQTRLENIPLTKKGIRDAIREYVNIWEGKGEIIFNWVELEGYTDKLKFKNHSEWEDLFVGKKYLFNNPDKSE